VLRRQSLQRMFQRLIFFVLCVTLIALIIIDHKRSIRDAKIAEIKKCERHMRIGMENEFEIMLLASFPGSGNTWARLLIEDGTGVYTGSVYIDKSLGNSGFLGEFEEKDSGTTIAVKCHGFNGLALQGIAKGVILLVRNPFDAILAEWNRRRSPKPEDGSAATHTGVAPPELYNSTLWTKQCAGYTGRWYELHKRYAQDLFADTKLHVVFFEDLRDNLRPTVRGILNFIHEVQGNKFNQTEEDIETRLYCIEKKSTEASKFKRKKEPLGFDPFSSEQKEEINEKIDLINKIFKKKKLNTLPISYKREL